MTAINCCTVCNLSCSDKTVCRKLGNVRAVKKWRRTLLFEGAWMWRYELCGVRNARSSSPPVSRSLNSRRCSRRIHAIFCNCSSSYCCCSSSALKQQNVVADIRTRSDDSCVVTSFICDISARWVQHLTRSADLSLSLKPQACLASLAVLQPIPDALAHAYA